MLENYWRGGGGVRLCCHFSWGDVEVLFEEVTFPYPSLKYTLPCGQGAVCTPHKPSTQQELGNHACVLNVDVSKRGDM